MWSKIVRNKGDQNHKSGIKGETEIVKLICRSIPD